MQVNWKDPINTPVTPKVLGTKVYMDYPIQDVLEYIDWCVPSSLAQHMHSLADDDACVTLLTWSRDSLVTGCLAGTPSSRCGSCGAGTRTGTTPRSSMTRPWGPRPRSSLTTPSRCSRSEPYPLGSIRVRFFVRSELGKPC